MSFALTTEQVRNKTKTVTRRTGWQFAKVGDVVQPVVKGQGIPKGGTVEKIGGPIRFVSVRREPLSLMLLDMQYGIDECIREGFGDHPEKRFPSAFVEMFCAANRVTVSAANWPHRRRSRPFECVDEVTRIEFEYLAPPSPKDE